MTTPLLRGRCEKRVSRENPRNHRSRIWKSEKSPLNLLKPICSKPSSSLWRRWQLSPLYICCAIKFLSSRVLLSVGIEEPRGRVREEYWKLRPGRQLFEQLSELCGKPELTTPFEKRPAGSMSALLRLPGNKLGPLWMRALPCCKSFSPGTAPVEYRGMPEPSA